MRPVLRAFAVGLSLAILVVASAQAEEPSALQGLGFGVGVGVVKLDHADVLETRLENGIVRVLDSEEVKRGFWLETHYLFAQDKLTSEGKNRVFFHGPFFGVQVSDDSEFVNSAALGYLFAFKRKRDDPDDKSSFNIGIGWANTKIARLGNGLVEDQPIPQGTEEIYLRKFDENGLVLMASFSLF